jgi:hypothetical protein
MGRVITNAISLSRAREASLGVLPGSPAWREVEPNDISNFGTTISRTTRTPISKARARRKGSVSDLDSGVEFTSDLTLDILRQTAEEFCFARAVGGDVFTPSAGTSGAYTVPAVSAGQAGRLRYGASAAKTLFYARGFDTDANNGLKVLGATVATSATTITITGIVAETVGATQYVELAVAGVRGATGDLQIDANGDLISTVLDFTTLGLVKGQVIHIGGVDVLNQFAETENFGFARARQIATHKITLEKREQPFVADTGASIAVDILFGQFVRNVDVDHADFLEASVQWELASPNLNSGGQTMFEYAVGNYCDAISIKLPLSDKATITTGYVGQDTTDPTLVRATNAANAKLGDETEAFGTSSDLARLRIQDVDEDGLTTDFKTITFTLTNNVAGEKVLAHLGPRYLNAGNIEADIESQMIFTSAAVPAAIRANATLGFDFALRNDDGGVVFDLPTGTLDGGKREFPANQSVLISGKFAAHQEAALDFSIGISFFPVLPAD